MFCCFPTFSSSLPSLLQFLFSVWPQVLNMAPQSLPHYLVPWFCTLAHAFCAPVLVGPWLVLGSCVSDFLWGLALEIFGATLSTKLTYLLFHVIFQAMLDWRRGRDLGMVWERVVENCWLFSKFHISFSFMPSSFILSTSTCTCILASPTLGTFKAQRSS